MSTDDDGDTPQISNRFDIDIPEENVRKYVNIDSKAGSIRSIIGVILIILLLVAGVDTIIPFIPIDGFILIVIFIIFLGLFFIDILLKPLHNERDSLNISRNSLARYYFDQAIEHYNNRNYKEVMNTLTELRAGRRSNINAITSHSKQLKRYIQKLEKRDEDEQKQYLKEDFPAIANAILAEYESRRHSHDVVSNSTDRIEFDRDDETEISLTEIYAGSLSGIITKERLGLLGLGGVVSIGLYYLIIVSTGIGAGLLTFGVILFGVLTHYNWI